MGLLHWASDKSDHELHFWYYFFVLQIKIYHLRVDWNITLGIRLLNMWLFYRLQRDVNFMAKNENICKTYFNIQIHNISTYSVEYQNLNCTW